MNFTDPTGYFTEDAIGIYLYNVYNSEYKNFYAARAAASTTKSAWKRDVGWWDMLANAKAGDVLFGDGSWGQHDGEPLLMQFNGDGDKVLESTSRIDGSLRTTTLIDVHNGYKNQGAYTETFEWFGFYRIEATEPPAFYIRNGYEMASRQRSQVEAGFVKTAGDAVYTIVPGGPAGKLITTGAALVDNTANVGFGTWIADAFDVEAGDGNVRVDGPTPNSVFLNFQPNFGFGWTLENVNGFNIRR